VITWFHEQQTSFPLVGNCTVTDGNDFTADGFFGRLIGDNNTRLSGLFCRQTANNDATVERFYSHGILLKYSLNHTEHLSVFRKTGAREGVQV
jgi:hypothetical protein